MEAREAMNKYPFTIIGIMREQDPPNTGYYWYPATGEIARFTR